MRYRTGDLVRPVWPNQGANRFVFLEGGIVGRADDMMIVRGMNIYPTAIENLRRKSSPAAWRTIPNAPGVQFYETGDSFDGSRILVLRDLFPSWPRLGVMACVPSRDLLMAVRLDSVASLKPVQTMIGICQGAYRDSPYQVSNQAFWFDGQLYERMRVEVEGKDIHIVPSERLTEVLNRLAESPGSR